jgi:hypothetical protein
MRVFVITCCLALSVVSAPKALAQTGSDDLTVEIISDETIDLSPIYVDDSTDYQLEMGLTAFQVFDAGGDSVWEPGKISESIAYFAETYKQCGIQLPLARFVKVKINPSFVLDDEAQSAKALDQMERLGKERNSNWGKPYVFFLGVDESKPWLVKGTAYADSSTTRNLIHTVWLGRKKEAHFERPEWSGPLPFTHEMTHLLADIYSYNARFLIPSEMEWKKREMKQVRRNDVLLSHDLEETNKLTRAMCRDIRKTALRNGLIREIPN